MSSERIERQNPGGEREDALTAAQGMSEWFPDYLYGMIDEPGDLPALTRQRLTRWFGEGDERDQLATIRDEFLRISNENQANAALYLCGFPDDVLDVLADEQLPDSLRLLDDLFLPAEPEGEAAAVRAELTPLVRVKKTVEVVRPVAPKAPSITNGAASRVLPAANFTAADDSEYLPWQNEALCAQTDPEMFFPEKGGSTRNAKQICIACLSRKACLLYALESDERFGIWGGLSERERRRLKRSGINPEEAEITLGRTTKPKVEPFRQHSKRIDHFVKLIADGDLGISDTYHEHPEIMARTVYGMVSLLYTDADALADRRRRLEAYFLHDKWNALEGDYGGAGVYYDALTDDLTDLFDKAEIAREAYEDSDPSMTFAEYCLERTELEPASMTAYHVRRTPKFSVTNDTVILEA